MHKIRVMLTAAVLAGAAVAGAQSLASAQGSQFIAHVESHTMLVTPVHLTDGEVIRLQGGQPFTVTSEQYNGGGTVAVVTPWLPSYVLGKDVVFIR